MAQSYIEKNRGYITASKIKLYQKSPYLYKKVYVDEADISFIKTIPAIEKGRMTDLFILTPTEFNKEFIIPDGKMLKADYIKALEEKGIEFSPKDTVDVLKKKLYGDLKVVGGEDSEMLRGISRELSRQPLWSWVPEESHKCFYDTQMELTMPVRSLILKGTFDRILIDHEHKTIVIRDLKTTSKMKCFGNNTITDFHKSMLTIDPFGYMLQMAIYKKLAETNYPGYKVTDVIIDAVGTSDPYFYEAYSIDLKLLDEKWNEVEVLLMNIEAFHRDETIFTKNTRAQLAEERYYKLDTQDVIQRNFTRIDPSDSNPPSITKDFNRDEL